MGLFGIIKALLPIASIVLHLKASADYEAFANSEVLQYTLLPSINKCEDYSSLKYSSFQV
jgi:hypothetical protein